MFELGSGMIIYGPSPCMIDDDPVLLQNVILFRMTLSFSGKVNTVL